MRLARTHSHRPRVDEQAGFTLAELVVALAVLGLVMTMFLGILTSVQRSMSRETARSSTMDQARLAMEAIDREVRSGSVMVVTPVIVTGPTACPPDYTTPDYRLNVYSLSAYSGTTKRWIAYRLRNQTLERGEFTGGAWQWRVVAKDIVNSGAAQAPFRLSTSSALGAGSTFGSREVDVTLLVGTPGDTTASVVKLTSSMTIRNQSTCVGLVVPAP